MTRPKRPYRFEVIRTHRDGEYFWWRFRLVAGNNKIVAWGEHYSRKSDCLKAVARVKKGVPGATVEVLP